MNTKRYVYSLLVLFIVSTSAFGADSIFCIGKPDGMTLGFGLSNASYHTYSQVFPKPIEYTVGKSRPADWPFIHPSIWDTWAGGGRAHTFTIKFENFVEKTAYLHIGLVDIFRTSELQVGVNGKYVTSKQMEDGSGDARVAFDPMETGKLSTHSFKLDKSLFVNGENTITLRLDKGSWIIYDYVALSYDKKAPKIQAPKPPDLLEEFAAGPMSDVQEIVFACRQPNPTDGHWYANFGYYAADDKLKAYRAMGRLCRMNLKTKEVVNLVDDPDGSVRDPQVHYDGEKIIFSYRKGGTENFHLYEINIDGTGLKQLTDGPYDDFEPTYVADGGIIFISSRCKRWVNCWLTQVAILYRCDADGKNIRQISSNLEHDNTPWPLHDGRILYQRWEYIDRSQVHYHHLWTANPDGTSQMVYYGNLHPGIVMIDAKPIPGTNKVCSIFSPGHGQREHDGVITIITPSTGPDDLGSAKKISRSAVYRDPWAFSEECFLAATNDKLVLMNGLGQSQVIYALDKKLASAGVQVHEPRPVIRRKREAMIIDRVVDDQPVGKVVLADVYASRNMEGVKRGEIKELLVLESLPKPINYTGGMEPLSYGGTFTLERIVGTIPVEQDGSAYMELPANRSFFFVALDKDGYSVKRMQSFMTVMPGETISCVGCHEPRTQAPVNAGNTAIAALAKAPSRPQKIADVPEVFDFPRDIQPILDKHCVKCHDVDERKGGVNLTGDHGPMYSHSYVTLTILKQVADGRNRPVSNYAPRTIGSTASPLIHKIRNHHNDVNLSAHEEKMIRLWIDSGAPYPGTYAALGNGMIGGYAQNIQNHTDFKWESTMRAAAAIESRCASCHKDGMNLPRSLSDENGLSFWMPDLDNQRIHFIRHRIFNLTRPEKSLVLMAPLSKEAGGYGICMQKNASGKEVSVFQNSEDKAYQAILAMCVDGREYLAKLKRFDMPGFEPPGPYVREMQRYGVLPDTLASDIKLDPYELDRKYWRSLWYENQ